MKDSKVLLFDGVCNLCNGVVQFIIKNETSQELYFASLQSDIGQELLKNNHLDTKNLDSLVYICNGKAFVKSKAVLKISKGLKSPWNYISYFNFIPKTVGDFFYNLVASNRYNLFGKSDSCWLPDQALLKRFL